jgi:hypothetical protein
MVVTLVLPCLVASCAAVSPYNAVVLSEAVRHERDISNAGRLKLCFAEIDQCKPVLLGLSLAGNLVKPLLSLMRPNGGSVATDSACSQRP